eukprot:2290692-Prymnesium_polylepis.1
MDSRDGQHVRRDGVHARRACSCCCWVPAVIGHFMGCRGGGDRAARAVGRRCGRAGAAWRARASGRCACRSS